MGGLYLFGAGGHAKAVVDVLLSVGIRPDALLVSESAGADVLGVPVREADSAVEAGAEVIVALGENFARERAAARFERFATAVHSRAIIGTGARIGAGSVVMAGAVIGPDARIGEHCVVNTGACIDHDCQIADFATIAPGAVLGGGVRIGRRAVVGLGARVIQRVEIGADTVVGAGAVVVASLPERVVAVGVPARILRSRSPEEQVFP